MFLFIMFYFQKNIYFSYVKTLMCAYEVLQKTVFSQRDISKCVVLANTVETDFRKRCFVVLIEVTIIRTQYLLRYCDGM